MKRDLEKGSRKEGVRVSRTPIPGERSEKAWVKLVENGAIKAWWGYHQTRMRRTEERA